MRKLAFGIGLTALVAMSTGALAQSATEGPLADPNAISPVPIARKIEKKAKRHKPSRTTQNTDPSAKPVPTATPAPGTPLPDDPVSFGMKWNGTNDNAQQQRIQNYNGTLPGTGAEVGMKLHF
jgi:hypothetical protein